MDEADLGITVVGDEIIIVNTELIAELEDMAARWHCTPAEALVRCLQIEREKLRARRAGHIRG